MENMAQKMCLYPFLLQGPNLVHASDLEASKLSHRHRLQGIKTQNGNEIDDKRSNILQTNSLVSISVRVN